MQRRWNPEWILNERIPGYESVEKIDQQFWDNRYEAINSIEKHLHQNGMRILKFFLNVSKEEQKERSSPIDEPHKNWNSALPISGTFTVGCIRGGV